MTKAAYKKAALTYQEQLENDAMERFKALLAKYPNIAPKAMGFPENRENDPLWKMD